MPTETPAPVPQAQKKLLRIDAHVHMVGDSSLHEGCRLQLNTAARRMSARFMLKFCGLSPQLLQGGLGSAYLQYLLWLAQGSSMDKLLVLAHDYPRREDGSIIESLWNFHVSNDAIVDICQKHPQLLPACSIHPARPDALDELQRMHALGVRVLKLLPNCLNIDYRRPAYRPFYAKMAQLGMALISHSGGEHTVPESDHALADPRLLQPLLEEGVTVIAAHAGGRSALFDSDWTKPLLQMLEQYPRLYLDNSALVSINRAHTLRHLLAPGVHERVIHGSDFPVPVWPLGPRLCGLVTHADYRRLRAIKNPLERDWQTKLAAGFSEQTATRLSSLLDFGA